MDISYNLSIVTYLLCVYIIELELTHVQALAFVLMIELREIKGYQKSKVHENIILEITSQKHKKSQLNQNG